MRDWLAAFGADMLLADGFDSAIVGVIERCDAPNCVVYCYESCVAILMKDGLGYEEAREYMDFNVVGAYMGPTTPWFLHRKPE